jgi:hypothetical protein
VQEYVDLAQQAIEDPASAGPELAEAGQELTEQATALGDLASELSPEEAARVLECGQAAADALAAG